MAQHASNGSTHGSSTSSSTSRNGGGRAGGGAGRRTRAGRWRSENLGTVAVGAVVAVAAGAMLLGDGYDYDAVCTDTATNRRVADDECSSSGTASGGSVGGRSWYYVPAGRSAPAVGQPVGGGTFAAPDGTRFSVHRGGVSAHGGTVSRGGFGGRLGTVGG